MKMMILLLLFFYSNILNSSPVLFINSAKVENYNFGLNDLLFFQQDSLQQMKKEAISDCNYSFEDALNGSAAPDEIKNNLALIDVYYYSSDNKIHKGQLLIHHLLAGDIKEIFDLILSKKFSIEKVIPIVKYDWSDELSMIDNNTSSFNYRLVAGTKKISNHAYGLAIDINPKLNPYIKGNHISPEGAKYNSKIPGTITFDSFIVKAFKDRGWTWGGDWLTRKDYQHFEKIID